VLIVRCQTEPARRPTTASSAVEPGASPGPAGAGAMPSTRPGLPGAAGPAAAPIIDEITVEKTSVCEGEENLVTVRAHTPGGVDDAFLHGVIAGEPGLSVPVVSFRARDGEVRPRSILVFGRGDAPVEVPLPAFEVRDCMAERRVLVELRLRSNTESEFDLTARIQELAATRPFEPVRWRWDFGDGTTAETTDPWIVHDFEDRPQDSLYASLMVRVEAIDGSGARIAGRQMIVIQNRAFANLVFAGTVTLAVRLMPRFPEAGPDGVVRGRVRLWHHRPDPVTIDRIVARRNYHDQRPYQERELEVERVLGTRTIRPSGLEIAVQLDTRAEPDLFSIDYWLEGTSAEGLPVRGFFPVMSPAAVPTRDDHIPVRDPAMTARILRARELLGQELVTDEDLWALERQGAFDDLPEPGTTPAGGAPPSYGEMPPHPERPGEPASDTPLEDGEALPAEPGAPPI
jgi:hypothetical protein